MRHAFALLLALVAASACSQKASAVESARDLASYCQKLERGIKGAAQDIRIPNTKEADTPRAHHEKDGCSVVGRFGADGGMSPSEQNYTISPSQSSNHADAP
jgi:hypothetical protein